MNMTLVFFLGLVSGGLVGIFLVGLVFLLRQGLKNVRLDVGHRMKMPAFSAAAVRWSV